MDREAFRKHKPFAGEKKPSMLRRRVGHDYTSRRIYLITMTVEGRRPLLGTLVGNAEAPEGSPDVPLVQLSPLGERVRDCWASIGKYYPEVRVLETMIMPDHLHGILFVERPMRSHLGLVIKGFKAGCNKAYRQLFSLPQHCCGIGDKTGNNQCDHLFSRNYNDHILDGVDELNRWFAYLRNNPRRLAMRRAHPEFFQVRFGITIGERCYAAIGNRFLLDHPKKVQVQCSRRLNDDEVASCVQSMLGQARQGAVLVSPAISRGEQVVMRAALDAKFPLIFLTPWGFNEFSHPGHEYYEACAEGRLLLLAPWEHENRRHALTREMCLELNAMVAAIAGL